MVMKELDNLEYELKIMLDNIKRVRDYADSLENENLNDAENGRQLTEVGDYEAQSLK